MNVVLAMCSDLPELHLAVRDVLIEEGARADRMFVLKSGAFEVVRNGVRVVMIEEPGAFMGEISVLLGSTATANVVAVRDSTGHVVENASSAVQRRPELTYAIAHLLARRLSALTAYLVDVKRQYADSNTHLMMMDEVLANLIAMQSTEFVAGSQREDVPDY